MLTYTSNFTSVRTHTKNFRTYIDTSFSVLGLTFQVNVYKLK